MSKEDQERILVVLNETNKLLKNPKTITKIETSFKNNVKESIKKGNWKCTWEYNKQHKCNGKWKFILNQSNTGKNGNWSKRWPL